MDDLVKARINASDGECGPDTRSLLAEAERQLAAFHQAVLSLHGPEAAQRAAEDWLHELETAAHDEPIHWGRVTLAAVDRLASRLTDSEHPPTHENSWRIFQGGTRQLLQCAHPCEAR